MATNASLQKSLRTVNRVTTVLISVSTIIGVYFLYKNNVWKPKVQLLKVDEAKGTAIIAVNGEEQMLYAGSTLSAGADWGVKFSDDRKRVELTKGGLVKQFLHGA